ncbi:MAG TPA: hypothetical protein DC049_04405 [Spirochaetia bacterium]|nr:hypothetical protein [Spirochaetia bacterium]
MSRNAPCPCGSEKKFKNAAERKQSFHRQGNRI